MKLKLVLTTLLACFALALQATTLRFSMYGQIGAPAQLTFNGFYGHYVMTEEAVRTEREVRLISYDSNTGKLILDVRLKGKFIGKLSGIYTFTLTVQNDGHWEESAEYKGVFITNEGIKIPFKLYMDDTAD